MRRARRFAVVAFVTVLGVTLAGANPAEDDSWVSQDADTSAEDFAREFEKELKAEEALQRRNEERLREERSAPVDTPAPGCFDDRAELFEEPGDQIYHRPLAASDFKATGRPKLSHGTPVDGRTVANASSKTAVVCVGKSELRRVGGSRYEVVVSEIEYMAIFSREKSWWGYERGRAPDWVLPHEQVHFDLVEIAARALTRDAHVMMDMHLGVGASPTEAFSALGDLWDEVVRDAIEDLIARQGEYDRETDYGRLTGPQRMWSARAARELADLPPPPQPL